MGVAKKFGALSENVEGKRLVLIDDSIVRGNTIGPIIKLLRDAGALEVHIRIASPPLLHPCYMGINIPTRGELIANEMNPEQLAKHVGECTNESTRGDGVVFDFAHIESELTDEMFFFCDAGADSLAYLSVDGLRKAVRHNMKTSRPNESDHCTACLTGEYPGGLPEELSW